MSSPLINPKSVHSLEEALEVLRYPTGNPVLITEVQKYLDGETVREEVRVALAMVMDVDITEVPE